MAKLIRRPKEEKQAELNAPERWYGFAAYKNMLARADQLEDLDFDKIYKLVAEARKRRPKSDDISAADNMIKVSNRGFKDQSVRTTVITYKMSLFRAAGNLENAIRLFRKTVIFEDAAWLNRNISTVKGRLEAPEMVAYEFTSLVDEARVLIDYIDILVEDIDKASFRITSGVAAIERETVPEKFTHR